MSCPLIMSRRENIASIQRKEHTYTVTVCFMSMGFDVELTQRHPLARGTRGKAVIRASEHLA